MKKKILLVIANYYKDISSCLLTSAKKEISDSYIIKITHVPGVFEIPVTIAKNINKFDGFLALGCVIKGETPHFDFISKATTDAIMNLRPVNYEYTDEYKHFGKRLEMINLKGLSSIDDVFNLVKNKVKDIESNEELLNSPPDKVLEALCDDLNTSKALAELNEIAGKLSTCSSDEASDLKAQLQASANVLGILQQSPEKWLGIGQTGDDIDKNKVESLIKEREEARLSKNFDRADQVRSELADMGIEIEDTPNGTIWRSK